MFRVLVWLVAVIGVTFLIGATTFTDSTGIGIPVQPQVVAASPAAPYTCAVGVRGKMIYVDDTDDTAEAYLCFCGTDADDSSYVWLRADNPATDCF
jgi:hypothetical protein